MRINGIRSETIITVELDLLEAAMIATLLGVSTGQAGWKLYSDLTSVLREQDISIRGAMDLLEEKCTDNTDELVAQLRRDNEPSTFPS